MIDPNVYQRAKDNGKVSIQKDITQAGADDDAVVITLTRYDEETGDVVTQETRTTLSTMQRVRQATQDELERLNMVCSDIAATLGVKA